MPQMMDLIRQVASWTFRWKNRIPSITKNGKSHPCL